MRVCESDYRFKFEATLAKYYIDQTENVCYFHMGRVQASPKGYLEIVRLYK